MIAVTCPACQRPTPADIVRARGLQDYYHRHHACRNPIAVLPDPTGSKHLTITIPHGYDPKAYLARLLNLSEDIRARHRACLLQGVTAVSLRFVQTVSLAYG